MRLKFELLRMLNEFATTMPTSDRIEQYKKKLMTQIKTIIFIIGDF